MAVMIVAAFRPLAAAETADPDHRRHAHRLTIADSRPYLNVALFHIATDQHISDLLADHLRCFSPNEYGGTTCVGHVAVGLRGGSVLDCERVGRLRIDCPAVVYDSDGELSGTLLATATISTKLTVRHGVHLTWWWNSPPE